MKLSAEVKKQIYINKFFPNVSFPAELCVKMVSDMAVHYFSMYILSLVFLTCWRGGGRAGVGCRNHCDLVVIRFVNFSQTVIKFNL